jgi:hypothetical protein
MAGFSGSGGGLPLHLVVSIPFQALDVDFLRSEAQNERFSPLLQFVEKIEIVNTLRNLNILDNPRKESQGDISWNN